MDIHSVQNMDSIIDIKWTITNQTGHKIYITTKIFGDLGLQL